MNHDVKDYCEDHPSNRTYVCVECADETTDSEIAALKASIKRLNKEVIRKIRGAYTHTENDHCPTRSLGKYDCNCDDRLLGCERAIRAIKSPTEK